MKPPAIHSHPGFLSSSAATAIKAKAKINPPKIATAIRIRPRGRIRRPELRISQATAIAAATETLACTIREKCEP